MDWHPRQDAYPVAWEMRDGARGHSYALIRQRNVRGRGVEVKEYELVEGGTVIGVYETGDDASMVAWARELQRAYPGREATITEVIDARISMLKSATQVVTFVNGKSQPRYPDAERELRELQAQAARDRRP